MNPRLAVLLFACFSARMVGVMHPLLGHQAWRQTDTWAVAQRMSEGGGPLWPMVYWGGGGVVAMEMPLYNTLLAAFGGMAPMGRLISAVLSTAAVYLFYRLLERTNGPFPAIWGAAFFGLLPMSVYFGRAVMPESLLLLSSVGAVYGLQRWVDTRWAGDAMACAVAVAVTGLVKPYGLLILLPMAHLLVQEHRREAVSWAAVAAMGVVGLAPVAWWYVYASNLADTHGLAFFDPSPGTDKWGHLGLIADPSYWVKVLGRRIGGKMLCWALVPLVLLGLLWRRDEPQPSLYRWWLLGGFVHLLLVAKGNDVHDYYQLPLLAPLCALAGVGAATLAWRDHQSRATVWLLTGLTVLVAGELYMDLMDRETQLDGRLPASEACRATVPEGAKVVAVGDDRSPVLLNLCQREGWAVSRDELDHDGLEELKSEGATWLVSPWPVSVEGRIEAEEGWMLVEL